MVGIARGKKIDCPLCSGAGSIVKLEFRARKRGNRINTIRDYSKKDLMEVIYYMVEENSKLRAELMDLKLNKK